MICKEKLDGWFVLQLILIVFACLTGCGGERTAVSDTRYTVPAPDSCTDEPDHRYFVSLPEQIPTDREIPLIITIDPHGDGYLAVQKFAGSLTGGIQAVIAGSQKIRNNYEGFEASLKNLFNDINAKYPVDPGKLIIAGMSGGARMAWYYGINNKVKGVIMFGAGPGRIPEGVSTTRLYAVSGTRDFNFMEQYAQLFYGMSAENDYFTDFFRGTHEWPPARNIYESVVYILRYQQDVDKSVLEDLSGKFLSEYDSLLQVNDLFFAGKALEKAWYFAPEEKDKERISGQIGTFKNMHAFTGYQDRFGSFLRKEIKLKQAYAERLNDPDTAWWRQEIGSLKSNINTCPDSMQADYLYRIKGFLGIILYAKINELLRQDFAGARLNKMLAIYEQVEPVSPDLFYFKALVQHRAGNEREAQELLNQAIKRGFSDTERIRQDFGGV